MLVECGANVAEFRPSLVDSGRVGRCLANPADFGPGQLLVDPGPTPVDAYRSLANFGRPRANLVSGPKVADSGQHWSKPFKFGLKWVDHVPHFVYIARSRPKVGRCRTKLEGVGQTCLKCGPYSRPAVLAPRLAGPIPAPWPAGGRAGEWTGGRADNRAAGGASCRAGGQARGRAVGGRSYLWPQ